MGMLQAGCFLPVFTISKVLISNCVKQLWGGVIRGIDFVYKEAGVNRPLTPEDAEKKNLNSSLQREG
jgi:hypothetical protein